MTAAFLNTLGAKARSRRGESITEVLVAIVVSGLAILMLATVIAAAANTNQRSRDFMDDYYAANNQLVETSEPNGAGTVTLTERGSSTPVPLGGSATVSVQLFIDEQADGTPVVSYEAEGED